MTSDSPSRNRRIEQLRPDMMHLRRATLHDRRLISAPDAILALSHPQLPPALRYSSLDQHSGQERQQSTKELSPERPQLRRTSPETLPHDSNFEDNLSVLSTSVANSNLGDYLLPDPMLTNHHYNDKSQESDKMTWTSPKTPYQGITQDMLKDNQEDEKREQEQIQHFESEGSPKKFEAALTRDPDSLPGLTEGTTLEPLSIIEESTGGMPASVYAFFEPSLEKRHPRIDLQDTIDQAHMRFDSRSVVSNDEDVASQATLERPAYHMWAEDYLASFLVEDPDIKALCKEALASIERGRVGRNLRRLLKSFYVSLVKRARGDAEKHAVALLRRRVSRERVAASMINSLNASTEEERLQVEGEIQAATVRVNAWLQKVQSGPKPDESHAISTHDANSSDSGSEADWEPEGKKSGPLDVTLLGDFIKAGAPVCQFRARLQTFLLPTSLSSIARILLTIASDRITFLDRYQQSLLDRVKCSLEKVSGGRWNCWPLHRGRPPLKSGQIRIVYQCHCCNWLWYDVSIPEADQLRSLVRLKGESTCGEHLCLNKRQAALSVSSLSFLQTRTPTQMPNAGNANTSSAQHPCVPAHVYQPGTALGQQMQSSGHSSKLPANSKPRMAPYQASGARLTISLPSQLYILLGVRRQRRNVEIGHLDTKRICDDGPLFQNLKTEYRQLRGFFRSCFSIWQLSHCEFVKFHKRFHNLGVFSKGYDLPTASEYTYDPRKPVAEDPPITAHEFREALSTCSASCVLRHFTFAHECQPQSRETTALKLIPKKNSMWDYKAMKPDNEVAWGLEACHEISALLVVIYHVILLSVPYGFWAYWQGVHPKDMQNASVPTTMAVLMISLFWTLSGIIQVLREPLASRT